MKTQLLKYALGLVFLIGAGLEVQGQDWQKRHAFAKSYFGLSGYYVPSLDNGSIIGVSGDVESFAKSPFITPSINIGATHFWGHADFYVSITTTDISLGSSDQEHAYRLGTFTGMRLFPYPSEVGKVRPYVGYKFSPMRYRQEDLLGRSFKNTQVKSVLDLGLAYELPNAYLTLEFGRVLNPEFDTYLSRSTVGTDKYPANLLMLGINYSIETTKPAATEASRKASQFFSSSNSRGIFLAAGPSSSFPTQSSAYVSNLRPYLDDRSFPIIFPDLAIGYHFTKWDIVTAASFRTFTQRRSAYDYEHSIGRQSLNFEVYKFLIDYHGFVPYLGAGVSSEQLSLSQNDNGTSFGPSTASTFSQNIVFGWDIRPSVKGDWWVLRTNLRYYPTLSVDLDGHALSLQHLEFNFIQFVMYPQRLHRIRKGF